MGRDFPQINSEPLRAKAVYLAKWCKNVWKFTEKGSSLKFLAENTVNISFLLIDKKKLQKLMYKIRIIFYSAK